MTDTAVLSALIAPEASALGFDLVRVKMTGGKGDPTLQIMAERPDTRQLTIDDCSALSRRVSDKLDELEAVGRDPIEGAYRLEVSSPGIDRPLTRLSDFRDWQGYEARVTLSEKIDGRKQFKGTLTGVDPEGVIAIETAKDEHAFVPFDRIADAKLLLTDRLIAATQPLSVEGAEEHELDMSADADGEEPADGAEHTEELN